jgi:uncharacterized protein YjiS (DUF1127 family)
MTDLRFSRPEFGFVFQYPHRPTPPIPVTAFGLVQSGLRAWQQFANTSRARRELMELDERTPRDIGLSRADARFGDLDSLGQQREQRRQQ